MPTPRSIEATCDRQVPVAVSYSSALTELVPLLSNPPATSVVPLDNKVAVCPGRPVLRLPVATQVPLAESYSSALAEALPLLSNPPATSGIPLNSKITYAHNARC